MTPVNVVHAKQMQAALRGGRLEKLGLMLDSALDCVCLLARLMLPAPTAPAPAAPEGASASPSPSRLTVSLDEKKQQLLFQLSPDSAWTPAYFRRLLYDVSSSSAGILFKEAVFHLSESCVLFHSQQELNIRRLGSLGCGTFAHVGMNSESHLLLHGASTSDYQAIQKASGLTDGEFRLLLLTSPIVGATLHLHLKPGVASQLTVGSISRALCLAYMDELPARVEVEGAPQTPTGFAGLTSLLSLWCRDPESEVVVGLWREHDAASKVLFYDESDAVPMPPTLLDPPDWFPLTGTMAAVRHPRVAAQDIDRLLKHLYAELVQVQQA